MNGLYAGNMAGNHIVTCRHGLYAECIRCREIEDVEEDSQENEDSEDGEDDGEGVKD